MNVEVSTVVDGSLWFDHIMGDMLQTAHTKPQVSTVKANLFLKHSNIWHSIVLVTHKARFLEYGDLLLRLHKEVFLE